MLASKPTSGLSLYAIIDFEASGRNCVAGEEVSSASGSATRSTFSNRFFGLSAEPRPLKPDGFFICLSGRRRLRSWGGRRGSRRSRGRGFGGGRRLSALRFVRQVAREALEPPDLSLHFFKFLRVARRSQQPAFFFLELADIVLDRMDRVYILTGHVVGNIFGLGDRLDQLFLFHAADPLKIGLGFGDIAELRHRQAAQVFQIHSSIPPSLYNLLT